MAYDRLRHDFPSILKFHGLRVVELRGWKGKGRPGNFSPVGVLCHHTASDANGLAGTNILVNGRPGLPAPLSQFSIDRQGTIYIVADGKANHAGPAKASGTVAGGEGNAIYWGIEAQNNGVGEKWPSAQYKAYVKLCAILCVYETGNSWRTVRAHKETSKTGKIDPTFNMGTFRARVSQEIIRVKAKRAVTRKTKKPAPKPKVPRKGKSVDQVAREVIAGKWGNGADRTAKLKRAGYSVKLVQDRVNKLLGGS